MKIIAKTFQGLEEVLAKEVTQLGADNIEIGNRMVSFTGDKEMLYRANFCLRTAVRVLMPIKEFHATDADQVYDLVKAMDWSQWMDVKNTFLIDSVVFSDRFRHSRFVAYRVKDAIADYFREKDDARPNVSISNPDIRINVHIADETVTLSLDSSGESLHKRGYRTGSVAAPLNEVLAAGMILTSGWDGECDFVDPFCGSGTLLVEAALIARNIYPGVFREEFGFERWKDFDADLLERIYNDDSQEREFEHRIYGFDINRQAVAIATDNVRSAGVSSIVDVQQRDFYDFVWTNPTGDSDTEDAPLIEPAIMMTNPPYGERITTDDILDLYSTIGSRLKQQFVGNDAWILSCHEECFQKIGFRPSTKFALYNGALPCELHKYQIFDGRLSDQRRQGVDIKSADERRRNKQFKPHRPKTDDKTFDGHSFRGEGSRDDEHYFRSRPDRKDFRRDRREGAERKERPAFRPLYEGDEEVVLNRRNFKWGDRGADFEEQPQRKSFNPNFNREGRRHDDRKPYGKDNGGRKPFRKEGTEGGKPFRKDKPRGQKPQRGGNPSKDYGDRRGIGLSDWGFDAEGRPFKRKD